MRYLITVFCTVVLISCAISDEELKKGFWKLCDDKPSVVGDVLELTDQTLKNNTVFSASKPIGVIIKKEKRISDNSNVIFVRWTESGDTSRFCQK